MTSPITTTDHGIPAGSWTIDPAHSTVAFTVRHLMSRVLRGQLRGGYRGEQGDHGDRVDIHLEVEATLSE